jgi:hypothetical protein
LIQQLETQSGRTIFSRFTAWYVPRFNAWSHPIRRTDEFAADAAAAYLTDARAMAEALCATVVRSAALDKLHWETLTAAMAEQAAPPADVISRLLPLAKSSRLPEVDEQKLLTTAYEADPDLFSTHPSLSERLSALGQSPAVPPLPRVSAAEAWLGSSLPHLAATLDATWVAAHAEPWRQRHTFLQEQRQRLHELTTRREAKETLTPDEQWELADLTEDHVSSDEALPLFRQLVDNAKWSNAASFSIGRILTNQDKPEGLVWLTEVMEKDPNYVAAGLAFQEAYHERQGDREKVRQLGASQLRHADVLDEAMAEREAIRATDQMLPHDLSDEALHEFASHVFAPENGIGRAWLLRKRVVHFATKPLYVLLVTPRADAPRRSPEAAGTWVQDLATKLPMPGEGFVIATGKEYAWLEKTAKQMSTAELFEAKLLA